MLYDYWHEIIYQEEDITDDTIILDNIIDSWKTMSKFKKWIKIALYWKPWSPEIDYTHKIIDWWINIPFEKEKDIEDHILRILQYTWDDTNREWLIDTPKRIKKSFETIYWWYKEELGITTFENESNISQVVWLSNIEFYSTCEHHMLPFFGKGHIYYIPKERIIWISKLARILDHYARRLQNQERLAKQVADEIEYLLNPISVAVILEWQHFCMTSRWVQKKEAIMKTSDLRWTFREDSKARQELFNLI